MYRHRAYAPLPAQGQRPTVWPARALTGEPNEYGAWRLPGAGTVSGAHIRGFWRAPLETCGMPATATVTGRELTCRCRRPTSEYRQYPISAYLAAAPPETPTHLQADLSWHEICRGGGSAYRSACWDDVRRRRSWTWLICILADAGCKKLITLVFGNEQERALRTSATATVQRAALRCA